VPVGADPNDNDAMSAPNGGGFCISLDNRGTPMLLKRGKIQPRVPHMDKDEIIDQARAHGFLLRKTRRPDDPGTDGCWLGGRPTLPDHIDWPWSEKGEHGIQPMPLHFIAQIKLDSIPWHDGLPEMPRTGTLFFFMDPIFAPIHEFDPDLARIIYVNEDVSCFPERSIPAGLPDLSTLNEIAHGYEASPFDEFVKWNFEFIPRVHYNSYAISDPALSNTAEKKNYTEFDRLSELSDANNTPTVHSMFAGARHVNDYSRTRPRVREKDRVPLLAISDDYDLGFVVDQTNYGVVFWIDRNDLGNGNFNKLFVYSGRA